MKIKTSELDGAALDWVVDGCNGNDWTEKYSGHTLEWILKNRRRYSTDWSQGGPILERAGITLRVNAYMLDHWAAFIDFGGSSCNIKARHTGPTPLIAAMRCYCCAKLGEFIEIPEELCQQQNN